MKKFLFFLFVLCFIVACNVPGSQIVEPQNATESSQDTPQAALAVENTPVPEAINAPLVDSPAILEIHMLDEVYGWGITDAKILRTNDGGVTWYDVTPPGLPQAGYGITTNFFDVKQAWIQYADPNGYPDHGTIYRTSDGGITWTSNSTPFSGGSIDFLDANNGWVMADYGAGAGSNAVAIFQTTDSGKTWSEKYTNDPNAEGSGDSLPLSGLKSKITAINMQTAWVSGVVYAPGSVYLFRTDDAGQSWSQVQLDLSPEGQAGDLSVDQVQFVSPTEGALSLMIGTDTQQTVIYTTVDAGTTWQLAPAKIPGSGHLEVLSAQDMVFYNNDQFYVTNDAAKTWSIVPPSVNFSDVFSNMSFANLTIGWVIASDSSDHRILYKTTDGGSTWSPIIQ